MQCVHIHMITYVMDESARICLYNEILCLHMSTYFDKQKKKLL